MIQLLLILLRLLSINQNSLSVTDDDTINLNGERLGLTCIDDPEKDQLL